jgi:uncharacterized protein
MRLNTTIPPRCSASPHRCRDGMYGSGFADLDGHRWNVMFMDFGKMPKG